MAHENKFRRSIETPDGGRCVDIFMRPDTTYGFEEYRRDSEDGQGWFPIGFFQERKFTSEEDAQLLARQLVPWLDDVL
ncbi:MAG: hypothetical protein MPJ78_05820 [Hyphomicrobiaceae bacterium]|nr:hypothetical protein [Hyphomicrobiaceae bacterium]